jgi:hypothetical protein
MARLDRALAPTRLWLLRSERATAEAYRDLVRASGASQERRVDAERWVDRVGWRLRTAERIAANRQRLNSRRAARTLNADEPEGPPDDAA